MAMRAEHVMPEPRRSKRFDPNSMTEKVVPILLLALLFILFAVVIIAVWTLVG
jgi:cell division septal protein FtsQ